MNSPTKTLKALYHKKIFFWYLILAGIFFTGLLFGFLMNLDPKIYPLNPNQQLTQKNENYLKLIQGYEELTDLYTEQGKNVATILDKETVLTNPTATINALANIDGLRDQILFQQGKIQQLRKTAGLLLEE